MKKRNTKRTIGAILGTLLAIGTAVAIPVGFAYGITRETTQQSSTQPIEENTAAWPVKGDEYTVLNPGLNNEIGTLKPATPPPAGNTPWSEPVVKDQTGTTITPEQVKDLPTGSYVTANYTSSSTDGKDKSEYAIAIKVTEQNTVPVNQTSTYMTRSYSDAAYAALLNFPPSPYIPTGYYLQKDKEYTITLNMAPRAMDTLKFGYGFYGIYDGQYTTYAGSEVLNGGVDPQITNYPTGTGDAGKVTSITTTLKPLNEGLLYLNYYGENKDNPYKIDKVEGEGLKTVPIYRSGSADPVAAQNSFLDEIKTTESPFVQIIGKYVFSTLRTSMVKAVYITEPEKHTARNTFEKAVEQWDNTVTALESFYGLQRTNPAANNYVNDKYQNIVNPDHLSNPQQSGAIAFNNRVTFQNNFQQAEYSLLSAKDPGDYLVWHEIGHTYQNPYFYFRSPSGSTVNYSFGEGADQIATGHLGRRQSNMGGFFFTNTMKQLKNWIDNPNPNKNFFNPDLPFGEWQQAAIWYQLVLAFGDKYFAKLMQEYRNMTFDQTTATLGDTSAYVTGLKDQPGLGFSEQLFPVMAAKIADRNLTSYFNKWGYPLSDKTKAELAKYPALETLPEGKEIWYNATNLTPTKIYDIQYDPTMLPSTAAFTTKSANGVVSVENASTGFEKTVQGASGFEVIDASVESLRPNDAEDKNKNINDAAWNQPHVSLAYVLVKDPKGYTIGYRTQTKIDYANTIRMLGNYPYSDDKSNATRLVIKTDGSTAGASRLVFAVANSGFYGTFTSYTEIVVAMKVTDATGANEKWSMNIVEGDSPLKKFLADDKIVKQDWQDPYLNVAEGDIITITHRSPNKIIFSDMTPADTRLVWSTPKGTTYKYKITNGKLVLVTPNGIVHPAA